MGFPAGLLRVGGASRRTLIESPDAFVKFGDLLVQKNGEELSKSRYCRGLSDLIEPPAKVRKAQRTYQKEYEEFLRRSKTYRESLDRKLESLFPELRELS